VDQVAQALSHVGQGFRRWHLFRRWENGHLMVNYDTLWFNGV
jgi:uncharacterized membrane protein